MSLWNTSFDLSRVTTPGVRVEGVMQPPTRTLTPGVVALDIQPLGPREAIPDPDLTRTRDYRKIYTQTELLEDDDQNGQIADHVFIDGIEYEVVKVADYMLGRSTPDARHYKVWVYRVHPATYPGSTT